jgi:hypothetical protein
VEGKPAVDALWTLAGAAAGQERTSGEVLTLELDSLLCELRENLSKPHGKRYLDDKCSMRLEIEVTGFQELLT